MCNHTQTVVDLLRPRGVRSGGAATDLSECYDLASPRRLDITRVGTILVERKVSAAVVVVVHIR